MTRKSPEPRWPSALALFAAAALHYSMPSYLTPGPDWLLIAGVSAFIAVGFVAHARGLQKISQAAGFMANALVTIGLITSMALLVKGLPSRREDPRHLLWAALAIWSSNILVFASWYWRLDAGGPHAREARETHTRGAFLFPQMAIDPALREQLGFTYWRPGFVDYLFVAFNTSTAFSPTDVPVLSRWAKPMMMIQSSISLGTLALLAARAINVL